MVLDSSEKPCGGFVHGGQPPDSCSQACFVKIYVFLVHKDLAIDTQVSRAGEVRLTNTAESQDECESARGVVDETRGPHVGSELV